MIQLKSGQHVHFIGIGGAGLSAIARVLLERGYQISGSDRTRSPLAEALAVDGATVYYGHAASHVQGADWVLRSSAVPDDHIEVMAARGLGIPVYKRSDVLAPLMAGQQVIGIAGTHGKTTTSSMIAHVLLHAGYDPSYITGGVLARTGTNAHSGSGPAFVIEADEYDHMFLGLEPQIAVVTNVEYDHPDFFPSPQQFADAFRRYVALLPDDGWLVACVDDPGAAELAAARRTAQLPTLTYGLDAPDADLRAVEVQVEGDLSRCTILQGETELGELVLSVPGRHNIANALAVLAVAQLQNVTFEAAAAALRHFHLPGRRFDVRGEHGGIIVVDDYAHHPTAIEAMVTVARQRYPQHDLWVIWQPHTYSRVRALFDAFVRAFSKADHVIITEIYAAREKPLPNISGQLLTSSLHHSRKHFAGNLAEAGDILRQHVRAPAVVLILSAGDAPQIGVDYLHYLEGLES